MAGDIKLNATDRHYITISCTLAHGSLCLAEGGLDAAYIFLSSIPRTLRLRTIYSEMHNITSMSVTRTRSAAEALAHSSQIQNTHALGNNLVRLKDQIVEIDIQVRELTERARDTKHTMSRALERVLDEASLNIGEALRTVDGAIEYMIARRT